MSEEMSNAEAQLRGFSITTLEVTYALPDYPSILSTFLWQEYDIAPKFPRMMGFLNFWIENIEGRFHSARFAHATLIRPAEIRLLKGEFMVH